MNELIKINSNNTVSARELYEFLESNQHFTDWMKARIIKYDFDENVDYTFHKIMIGKTYKYDYEITVDMAKELCMIENNEKGKQARGYFINCEKKLKEIIKKPLTTMEQLKLHYLALEEQNKEIHEVKADVTYLKNNMPLFNIDCKELQALVRKIGCNVLGGYGSNAYKSNSIRQKVYTDIQHQLKREFGVTRYEAIKRHDLLKAQEIVNNYIAPTYLVNEISAENNQIPFSDYQTSMAYL